MTSLDYENYHDIHASILGVTATDQGTPPLTAKVTVKVNVLDHNDHAPMFSKPTFTFNVTQDMQTADKVNAGQSLVGRLEAWDMDQVNAKTIDLFMFLKRRIRRIKNPYAVWGLLVFHSIYMYSYQGRY